MRKKLLVVDDEFDIVNMLRDYFEMSGYDVLTALSGAEALEKLRLQPEEVMDARWADRGEVLRMIDDGSFIPYRKSLVELLFDMRGKMGMLPVPWPERT